MLAMAGAGAFCWFWTDRPTLQDIQASNWSEPLPSADGQSEIRGTRWGVATLLFDDGETQILIDGYFTRVGVWELATARPVSPDGKAIDSALDRLGATRVRAIVPVHSHFDHMMDTAEVAKRTGAIVVGSRSTATFNLGMGLPSKQMVTLPKEGGTRKFGRFEIELRRSLHAPLSPKGGPRFPGEIELAFSYPAPVSSWREGGSYTVILRHPAGTIVVQGSAGFVPGALKDVKADVVFLGIGGLIRIGEPHFRNYWREVVRATGAPHVVPVHYDDLTRPADAPAIGFFPRMIDDAPTVIGWMQEQTDADVSLIPWREPIVLLSAKP